MADLEKLNADLKRLRDEIRLKIYLGSREAQSEWQDLEERWTAFREKAELSRSAGEVGGTMRQLGADLKCAFERIRKAI